MKCIIDNQIIELNFMMMTVTGKRSQSIKEINYLHGH